MTGKMDGIGRRTSLDMVMVETFRNKIWFAFTRAAGQFRGRNTGCLRYVGEV